MILFRMRRWILMTLLLASFILIFSYQTPEIALSADVTDFPHCTDKNVALHGMDQAARACRSGVARLSHRLW